MKVRLAGAESFHADGLTDMTKLIVALRNFANASKKRVENLVSELKICVIIKNCTEDSHLIRSTGNVLLPARLCFRHSGVSNNFFEFAAIIILKL
jgi:hypothetical protein